MDVKTKYPKSIHNKQCIGQCRAANTYMLHPVTHATEYFDAPHCPTDQWLNEDGKTQYYDQCHIVTSEEDEPLEKVIPTIHFNPQFFLQFYYNITTFDAAVNFLTTNNLLLTKFRVIECAWRAYSSNVDYIVDTLVAFYIDVIKKHWIRNIMNQVKDLICVSGGKIKFGTCKQSSDDHMVEKTNFFIEKMVTHQNIYRVLQDFAIMDKSNVIMYHDVLLEKFINYFVDKIKELS